jgi:hypothetical protein
MIIVALCAFVLLMVLIIKVKPEPEIPNSRSSTLASELDLEKNVPQVGFQETITELHVEQPRHLR